MTTRKKSPISAGVVALLLILAAFVSPSAAEPCIDVTKTVEPTISMVGEEVTYTICVSNCGETPLLLDIVLDTMLGDLTPAFPPELGPGESACVDFPYMIQQGDPDPLFNDVIAFGIDETGAAVDDFDFAEVDLVHPDFTVDKICPPVSKVGDEVCYTVIITNTGDVPMLILDAFDTNIGPIIPWIGEVIDPGEVRTYPYCIIVPPDATNPWPNEAYVIGEALGLGNLRDDFAFCEVPLVNPQIDLEKAVNDPNACPGDTVIYTICIENTGDWPLENVEVTDPNLGGILIGFPTELAPGEIWCEDFPYTVPVDADCPLVNCAEVTANAIELGNPRDANDCAEICCEPPPPPGGEGCVPGFWMNNGDKHGASAWCDRFDPSDPISMHFVLNESLVIRGKGRSTITNPTLLQALNANGGGVNAMIRHGIAAMLNACSDCVQYEYSSEDQVIFMIEDALNGVGGYTVGELHSMFASYNEAGCPVNQHGECVGVEDEF